MVTGESTNSSTGDCRFHIQILNIQKNKNHSKTIKSLEKIITKLQDYEKMESRDFKKEFFNLSIYYFRYTTIRFGLWSKFAS